jgi:hypothetical protein
MTKRHESIGFRAALLFLALSVFAWGLNAKLSLYKTVQPPATTSSAKLSTDTRCAETIATISKTCKLIKALETVDGSAAASSLHQMAVFPSKLRQAQVRQYRSCEVDSQAPPQMRRPPPILS